MFLPPAEYHLSDFWERKTSICKQQGASHESSKAEAASRPASYIKDLNIWQSAIMKQLRKGSEAWLKLYRINKTCGAPLQRDVRKIYIKGSLLTTHNLRPEAGKQIAYPETQVASYGFEYLSLSLLSLDYLFLGKLRHSWFIR